jgi:putative flippase GtrA
VPIGTVVALRSAPPRRETIEPDEFGTLSVRVITYEPERRLPALAGRGRRHIGQLARFCCVGASGYVLNLAIFRGISVALPYLVAFAVAFGISATWNFWWNRHWTFDAAAGRTHHQFARFLTVSLAALIADLAILATLVEREGMGKLAAAAVAIALVTPVSFLGNKLWSFSRGSASAQE